MKYTFQTKEKVDFLCSKCFHRNRLTFNTKISGDPEDAIPPRVCIPYSHSANVRCGKCGAKMFAVDRNISKMVQKLNLIGYNTKTCCSGHYVTIPVNPQVVGSKMEYDDKVVKYSSNERDFISEYKNASTHIDIDDIKGLPEHKHDIDTPFLWFRHDMPDSMKESLISAIEKVIKEYKFFQVKVYPCNKHGSLLERKEVKLGETEYSCIVIETDKCYMEEFYKYYNVCNSFKLLLIDIIIELDRISKAKK